MRIFPVCFSCYWYDTSLRLLSSMSFDRTPILLLSKFTGTIIMFALLTDLQESENGQASMARTFLEILQCP